VKRALCSTLLFLALCAAVTLPANAADTCTLQGSCLGHSRWCDFRVSFSCMNGNTNPAITATCDNNNANYVGAVFTHNFATSSGGSCTVTCNCGGSSATAFRRACFVVGVSGCILPDQGYN
jgi:hypothetical protein